MLLFATKIPSEGTEFGLDFFFVEVHDRDFQPAQFVGEPEAVHAGEFRRFAKRKPADLEQADGQLEREFFLNGLAWLAAGDQQIVGIVDGQFSHASRVMRRSAGCKVACGLAGTARPVTQRAGARKFVRSSSAGNPFGRGGRVR